MVHALRHKRDIAAATIIQTMWRGTVARQRYIQVHRSTVLLEKVIRGWTVRKDFTRTVRGMHIAFNFFPFFDLSEHALILFCNYSFTN
jgi:hypothetical protein